MKIWTLSWNLEGKYCLTARLQHVYFSSVKNTIMEVLQINDIKEIIATYRLPWHSGISRTVGSFYLFVTVYSSRWTKQKSVRQNILNFAIPKAFMILFMYSFPLMKHIFIYIQFSMKMSLLQTHSLKQPTHYVNSSRLFFYFSPKCFSLRWPVVAKTCRR